MIEQNQPISRGDIQITKDYKEVLDDLNSSLRNVNSTLPTFADGVNAGLKAIAEKLPDVINSITKLNLQNKELVENGQKPVGVFNQLVSSLLSWNGQKLRTAAPGFSVHYLVVSVI